MLKAKAEIQFTLPNRTYRGHKHFRPVFGFGEGLLFSGLIPKEGVEYLPNKKYLVDVLFFTIQEEAYSAIKPILKSGMGLTIQEGARVTGNATLVDFAYEKTA